MSEAADLEQASDAPVDSSQTPPAEVVCDSAGTLLRRAREAAGVDLAALAVTLKVPARKLEALEADQLDQLPGEMFTRALAASVCRALHIDAAPVLQQLPQAEKSPFHQPQPSLNTPFRASGGRSSVAWSSLAARPAVWVIAALLLGAVLLLIAPSVPGLGAYFSRTADTGTAVDTAPARAGVGAASTSPAPAELRAADTVATPQANPAPLTALAPASNPSVAPALTPATALAAPAAVADLVRFSASADTWVEVVDAAGKQPLRRVLNAGDSVSTGGALPLKVTVGRADAVQVLVRGKPLDLAASARDNVARFEVK